MKKFKLLVISCILLFLASLTLLSAQELPPGWSESELELDLQNPMDMEIITVGGIEKLVALENDGDVWVFDNVNGSWDKKPSPIISVPTTNTSERGAYNFVIYDTNKVIISYTLHDDVYTGVPDSPAGLTENRVTSSKVDWIENSTEPEIILARAVCIGTNHMGLGLALCHGSLYATFGDGGGGQYMDDAVAAGLYPDEHQAQSKYRAQMLGENPLGKVFRIDPVTGQGFTDNPFYDGDADSWMSKLWGIGLRNPWKMEHGPNHELMISDVGQSTRETIHRGHCAEASEYAGGLNYGWGRYEGFADGSWSASQLDPNTGEPFVINQATSFDWIVDLNERITTRHIPALDYGSSTSAFTNLPVITNGILTTELATDGFTGNSVSSLTYLGDNFGAYSNTWMFADVYTQWIGTGFVGSGERYFDDVTLFASGIASTQNKFYTYGNSIYILSLYSSHKVLTYDEGTLSTGSEVLDNPDSIIYYTDTQLLKIDGPVTVYNVPGQKVMRLEASSVVSLITGTYIAKQDNGVFKKFVVK